MRRELVVDWLNTSVNYGIIVFLFLKAIVFNSLDSIDILVTLSGLFISIIILVIKVVASRG